VITEATTPKKILQVQHDTISQAVRPALLLESRLLLNAVELLAFYSFLSKKTFC
jgi:hypothetical protein